MNVDTICKEGAWWSCHGESSFRYHPDRYRGRVTMQCAACLHFSDMARRSLPGEDERDNVRRLCTRYLSVDDTAPLLSVHPTTPACTGFIRHVVSYHDD